VTADGAARGKYYKPQYWVFTPSSSGDGQEH